MTITQMQDRIRSVYGDFVKGVSVSRMPDNQVVAVYKSMERRGAFNRLKQKKSGYKQLSLFDKV